MRRHNGCDYGSGTDAPCAGRADIIMVLAWMLWETVREPVDVILVLTYILTEKLFDAMCGCTSGFEASEDHEMLFVPRRPVLMGLAVYGALLFLYRTLSQESAQTLTPLAIRNIQQSNTFPKPTLQVLPPFHVSNSRKLGPCSWKLSPWIFDF